MIQLATKTQKNFRKEMKKFEKERRRKGGAENEPLSYIYKHQSYPSTGRFGQGISNALLMAVRVAIIVGILSFTGIFDSVIKKMKEEKQPSEIVTVNHEQILINYLDQYETYNKKAYEVIDRYNFGKLDLLEIYAIQKVLMESIIFTEQTQDASLEQLNETVIGYHQALINWLTGLVEGNSEQVNRYVLSLNTYQQHIFTELAQLFDQLNIPYEYSTENGISYRLSN